MCLKVSAVGTFSTVLLCSWRIWGMLLLCGPSGWVSNKRITTGHSIVACLNWSGEQMCSATKNKWKHETRHPYKHIQTLVCVDSGTKERGECLSLCPNRVLSGYYLLSLRVNICVAVLHSMLRDRTGTRTCRHTQRTHHSKSLPHDTGNNDKLMPKSLSQFS